MTGPPRSPGEPYADDAEHLRDELRRLDLLIRLRVRALRGRLHPESQVDRTLYIDHGEADRLLAGDAPPAPADAAEVAEALTALSARIDRRERATAEAGTRLALPRLSWMFGLTGFERQAVMVCLAPELRRHYDRLYAYLQDDITRRCPTVDLIGELLCSDEAQRWAARAVLGPGGRLRRAGLVDVLPDPNSPSGSSGLAQFLRLDERVLAFLLGDDHLDQRLDGWAWLHPPAPDEVPPGVDLARVDRVFALVDVLLGPAHPGVWLHLHGPVGAGKRDLAHHVAGRFGLPLLVVDVPALLAASPEPPVAVRAALREGLLRPCAVYLSGAEALLDPATRAVSASFVTAVHEFGRLVLTGGGRPWRGDDEPDAGPLASIEVPLPGAAARTAVWEAELAGFGPQTGEWAGTLGGRYRLGPQRIRAAVTAATADRLMDPEVGAVGFPALAAACRAQSGSRLAELADKVEPCYGWADLVLPADRLQLLREICDQVRQHTRVYDEWGFGSQLAHGTGLTVLFSGPPGTGKTMAAQVVAGDVGLDLFRIDLSRVVSKYIGETEKNLSRIFDEARAGNVILFFDEADALFGKRSEVTDAHDRYANIETGYLLQRLDIHDGVVLLATNLRQNIDDAFTRRIRFLVDFPFPDEEHRRRIWEGHFPPAAPRGPDVDCAHLAREFPVAGGSIKNIILNAAFLAAADGGAIRAEHLLAGTRREFDKVGKVWVGGER